MTSSLNQEVDYLMAFRSLFELENILAVQDLLLFQESSFLLMFYYTHAFCFLSSFYFCQISGNSPSECRKRVCLRRQ